MLYLQNGGEIICAAQDTNIKGISAPMNSYSRKQTQRRAQLAVHPRERR